MPSPHWRLATDGRTLGTANDDRSIVGTIHEDGKVGLTADEQSFRKIDLKPDMRGINSAALCGDGKMLGAAAFVHVPRCMVYPLGPSAW